MTQLKMLRTQSNTMKNTILLITTITFLTSALFLTSCSTPSEKVVNAEENVTDAQKDLDKANAEYLTDMETYRKETAAKITTNNESIADFNKRIENQKAEAKVDYKKRITELEKKNTDMKKRLEDYKADGKENWELFKMEFSRDMEELGKAFKDLTVTNVK
jgi:uncharacterized lipoprotein YajG